MRFVYYCENTPRHIFEQSGASVIYYEVDTVTNAMHCKATHTINMKPDPTTPNAGDQSLLLNPTSHRY